MQTQNENRMIRRLKLPFNPFVDNLGKLSRKSFYTSYFLAYMAVLSMLMFGFYVFEYWEEDYFQIGTRVQHDILIVLGYVIFNFLDGEIFGFINVLLEYLGIDFQLSFKALISMFFDVKYDYNNFKLNTEGWIMFGMAGIISFFFYVFIFYQYKVQIALSSISIHDLYVPKILLWQYYKRNKNEYFYTKRLLGLRKASMTQETKDNIKEIFFNNVDDLENKDVKMETKTALWGWYPYFQISLIEKKKRGR